MLTFLSNIDLAGAAVFFVFVCLPLMGVGFAWGMGSVRQPRTAWHRRLRWTWLVVIAVLLAFGIAPIAFALQQVLTGNERWGYFFGMLTNMLLGALPTFIVFAVLPAVGLAWMTRTVARASGRWCVKCGYDLRASHAEMCPECGTAITAGQHAPRKVFARKVRKWAVRGAIGAGAAAVVTSAVLAAIEFVFLKPQPRDIQICRHCGAIQHCEETPTVHIPLPAKRAFSFASSDQCAHQWLGSAEAMAPGEPFCRLLLTPESRDVLAFSIDDPDGDASKSVHGCVQFPPQTDARACEFEMWWRRGPGLLSAADARHARAKIVFLQGGRPALGLCEPADRQNEVRDLVMNSDPLGSEPMFYGFGGPGAGVYRPAYGGRLVPVTQTNGTFLYQPLFASKKAPSLGVVPAAEWPAQQNQPLPWKNVPMARDIWERYGAPAAGQNVLQAGEKKSGGEGGAVFDSEEEALD